MYKQDMVERGIELEHIRQMIRQQVALGHLDAAKKLADDNNISNVERLDLGITFSKDPKHDKSSQFMGCV